MCTNQVSSGLSYFLLDFTIFLLSYRFQVSNYSKYLINRTTKVLKTSINQKNPLETAKFFLEFSESKFARKINLRQFSRGSNRFQASKKAFYARNSAIFAILHSFLTHSTFKPRFLFTKKSQRKNKKRSTLANFRYQLRQRKQQQQKKSLSRSLSFYSPTKQEK